MSPISRRRALLIGAAAIAAPILGAAAREAEARWQGQALGAHAEIRLRHMDKDEARPVFAEIEAELARLEAIFSLYRPESAIARLNRDGRLDAPPAELVELLALSKSAHAATEGLFDPTIQPLFRLYAETAAAGRAVRPDELEATLDRVGFAAVQYDGAAIRFLRPGMALSLNGVAQGYVTDRIAALLRRHGLHDVLVDMGEIAAVGRGPSGQGWRVAIAEAGGVRSLVDRAVATSAPRATLIDATRAVGHIFAPAEGWIEPPQRQVTVLAESAAIADALSTAGVLMPTARLAALAGSGSGSGIEIAALDR